MHAEIVAKLIQRKKSRSTCALNALARVFRGIAGTADFCGHA
jgi:hypothetical protein